MSGGVTNVLAAEAPSGVPSNRSDVIACEAAEVVIDEISRN